MPNCHTICVKTRRSLRFAVLIFLLSGPIALADDTTETIDGIVACMNRENGHGAEPFPGKGVEGSFARRLRHEIKAPYHLVNGNLGWHVSWVVLVDLSQQPFRGYETYGLERSGTGAFGRRPIPWSVTGALAACGVRFEGHWQGTPPWVETTAND